MNGYLIFTLITIIIFVIFAVDIIIIVINIFKVTNVPHQEVSEQRILQAKIINDSDCEIDVNETLKDYESVKEIPVVFYEDIDFDNSTTLSDNSFKADDKENASCESKRKKQKTGLLQNPLSKTINWNSSTTTASSCDNKFIKSELLDKKKIVSTIVPKSNR